MRNLASVTRASRVALVLLAVAIPTIVTAQPGNTPPRPTTTTPTAPTTTPPAGPPTTPGTGGTSGTGAPTTPTTGAPRTPTTGAPTTPTTPTTGAPARPGAGEPTTGAPMPVTGMPEGKEPPQPADPGDLTAVATDGSVVDPDQMPTNLRLRRLEQRVQALKERAWRAKARTTQLKEAVLGGGVGAQATIVHVNRMGSAYRLSRLVYALDGTQIFARSDDTTPDLYKGKNFDILTGPISPGSHTISVLAVYKGHGYGVFKYLNKYSFTLRSSHTFTAAEGKNTRVEAIGFERGGSTTPLDKRPAMDFKVNAGTGEQ